MSLHIVILAAGESRRCGDHVKQLFTYKGKTLLEWCFQHAAAIVTLDRITVVLGFAHEQLRPIVNAGRVIINPTWQNGMGNSLACGVASLPASASAVLVMLCDQVALTQNEFVLLCNAYNDALRTHDVNTAPIVCAGYAGNLGVPAIFPRRYFAELMALDGDVGAKKLLQSNSVIAVPMAAAATDIDTPSDWSQFLLNH